MKRLLFALAVLLFSSGVALAQRTITGTVTGDGGEPLVGATVKVKGANKGAVTDVNGRYSVVVPEGTTTLQISYTGFESQEAVLGASNIVDVLLAEGAVLSEAVVVGYGTQQKRSITGTVSTVKGDDIAQLPAQSFDQLLQGRAPGVNINIPNGVLNNPPVIRVRGINSINLSSIPLIVIDGVPTYTNQFSQNSAASNPLSSIDPNDIASVEILKDASAAAIYGSRAAAGVMLITTKRGKAGKTRVQYNTWASATDATRVPDVLTAEQYVTIKNEAAANAGLAGPQYFLDTINGKMVDTRWEDYIYRRGFSHSHNLSFGGGTDKTSYYISLGLTQQEGMIVNNSFDRWNARLNFDHNLTSRIKVGGNVAYGSTNNSAPNTGSLDGESFNTGGIGRLAFVLAPIVDPYKYNADGTQIEGLAGYNVANGALGVGKNKQSVGFLNPMPLIDLNRNSSRGSQIQTSAYAQYEIIDGLRVKTQFGIDNLAGANEQFWTGFHGDGLASNGRATNIYVENKRWNWQNTIDYSRTIADKHDINVLVGQEEQGSTFAGWGATRTNVADPFFTTYQGNYTTIDPSTANFQSANYLLSYFGRFNYGFNNRYFLTANLRQDEYSAFAPGEKKGLFWGVSAGWALSEEQFWQNSIGDLFNYFKIRGSYGTVGNNGIGDFTSQYLYNSGLYGTAPTFTLNQAGNSKLSWETSKKTDVGFVFGLKNDRIQGEYTYFQNVIDGLILFAPQAPSRGIPNNQIPINVGAMKNVGHEMGITATIVSTAKFSWKSNFNVTFMSNEVTELYENSDIYSQTSGLETTNITRVGEAVGSLIAVPTMGVNPENGRRLFVKKDGTVVQYNHAGGSARWTTLDGTTVSAPSLVADGVVQGSALPKWFGGWDNTFTYGPIDFNVQVNYAGGHKIYNGSKAGLRDQRFWNNHQDVMDRWTETNTGGTIPKVVFGDNVSNGSSFAISENVEKGDFLRIRNITLGYKIPTGVDAISNLRVYASMSNAFLFTNYTGTDPEVSSNGNRNVAPGVDRNTVPMSRTMLVGLNLSF